MTLSRADQLAVMEMTAQKLADGLRDQVETLACLTPQRAAEFLGMSVPSLRTLPIPWVEIGHRRRYQFCELKKFVDKRVKTEIGRYRKP